MRLPLLLENLLDLFYPPSCLVCEKTGAFVHPACHAKMPYLTAPLCQGCGIPLSLDRTRIHTLRCKSSICLMPPAERALERVSSVFAYRGGGRQAALRLKYKGVTGLSKWLGQEMAQAARHYDLLDELDYVLPVPLHQKRLRERGYNQAALLSRVIGRELGLPGLENRLVRQRYTRSQVGLGATQRAKNVAEAFEWRGEKLEGQAFLLIDDVCTTGATLNACAATLKAAGASRVLALTLTREFNSEQPPSRF